MSVKTGIEWTDATWNCARGCTKVSAGCTNCYALSIAGRFSGPGLHSEGFAEMRDGKPYWTGKLALIEDKLDWPLRWRGDKRARAEGRPSRIFVNSMSDLFHEALPDEAIDRVFAVMALAPQHTFQILTKRPERMGAYLTTEHRVGNICMAALDLPVSKPMTLRSDVFNYPSLKNVWLGVSVEDQATADERIPLLLQTPAAVRFVSYEPALEAVAFDLSRIERDTFHHSSDCPGYCDFACGGREISGGIDWIICGGESGRGARPFDVAWARSTIDQCVAAGVACFVKQLGANVECIDVIDAADHFPGDVRLSKASKPQLARVHLSDRKGGEWSEWPSDIRVREFPV